MTASSSAIVTNQLGRTFSSRGLTTGRRETVALDALDLDIPAGTVFGLLGPNGAGKTTTVRILTTLLAPTTGSATVGGYDVARRPRDVRRHIGLVLGGDRGLYGRLSGWHNLRYFAALNHMRPRHAAARAELLLDQFGLAESRDTPVEQYSRGMKQRLHLARGLLSDPEILFLDEPTMGLDPVGAQEMRELVPSLSSEGKTVMLTTHYMSEADKLCDRIAIIVRGRLTAIGTPADIKQRFSRISIIEVIANEIVEGVRDRLLEIDGLEWVDSPAVDGMLVKYSIHTRAGLDLRDAITTAFPVEIVSIVQREPTLEEAYLSLVK